MKTYVLGILFSLIAFTSLFAQKTEEKPAAFSVSFNVKDTLLHRISEIDNFYQFTITVIGAQNQKMLETASITVVSDDQKSSLLEKNFTYDPSIKKIGELGKETRIPFSFKLKKEAAPFGEDTVVLKIIIVDSAGKQITPYTSSTTEMMIRIPGKSQLNDYSYLAYVGTNFDLVDGIKAKNLFFATNIFLHPRSIANSWGFNLGVYGNRTFMSSDSIRNIRRLSQSIGTGDTITDYFETTNALRTQVSDNIGATFSPLIKLWCLSKADNQIKLYFAPTAEFIWRRVQMDMKFNSGMPTDTIDRQVTAPFYGTLTTPDEYRISFNEYVFNAGGGIFVTHETKTISIRIGTYVAYQRRYTPTVISSQSMQLSDPVYNAAEAFCFGGRMWITDNASGITLQAEITNTFRNSRPYYGVTLSKAINFSKLGTLFQPLSSR